MTAVTTVYQRVLELAKAEDLQEILSQTKCPWDQSDGGKPLASSDYRPTGNAKLDGIVERLGARFHYGGNESCNVIVGGIDGIVDPVTRMVPHDDTKHFIRLPLPEKFATPKDYRETVAHELIHWVETRTRPQDTGLDGFQQFLMSIGLIPPPRHYAVEEAAAEIGSAMLLEACGVDPDCEQRARYATMYLHDYPDELPAMLDEATAHAAEDVNYLLQLTEKMP